MLTYDYSRHPFGDWDDRRIVPLFPVLEFTALDSESTEPEGRHSIRRAPRRLPQSVKFDCPTDYHADLPDPIHVKTDFATFDKTYRFDSGEIIAERDIVILKQKIPKADWKKYLKFTKDISLSGENWIQLLPPNKTTVMKPVQMPAAKDDQTGRSVSVKELQAEQAASKNAPATPKLEKRPDGVTVVHIPAEPTANNPSPAPRRAQRLRPTNRSAT